MEDDQGSFMMKGQVTLFSSKADEHATPQWLFDKLHAEFEFTLDPCATKENAKCEKFFTLKEDGLKQSWLGERVFCNPPYTRGQARKWIQKGVSGGCEIVVFLLRARTDTKNLFHKYFYDTSTWDYRPGVPDWVLPVARGSWVSLMIEFKNDAGRLSKDQEDYHRIAKLEKNKVMIHRDAKEAVKEVINYLNL